MLKLCCSFVQWRRLPQLSNPPCGDTFPFILKISGNSRSEDLKHGTSPPDLVPILTPDELMEDASVSKQHPVLQSFILGLSQSHQIWSMMVPLPSSCSRAGCTGKTKPGDQIWSLAGDQSILIAQQELSHGLLRKKKEFAQGANSSGFLRPGLSALECQSCNMARERMFKGACGCKQQPHDLSQTAAQISQL